MTEVVFSAKKKGESRYEETISDRPATGGARVSATGPRAKPQPTDDGSDGRGGRPAARRSRPPDARGRVGVDEPGDGRRSAPSGRGAARAASGAAGAPLGERSRVLRGGRAEGADPAHASAHAGTSRAAAGQLRDVSAQRANGARGVGQADARTVDAQLRRGGERFSRSLRGGEVGGERELHRLQPREVTGVNGASAGRVALVRGANRRHTVPRPADDRGPGNQCGRA